MKAMVMNVIGHWRDEPDTEYSVLVSLGAWDGEEDEADGNIFYYTDGEPIKVGDIIANDFVITEIY